VVLNPRDSGVDVTVRSPQPARMSSEALQGLLATGEELTVVCHNNPDPDCLASSLALGAIAEHAGIDERHILYSGTISHQQNRAFINLLDMKLRPFAAEAVQDRPDGSLMAFVDHAVPGENNEVPPDVAVDIVIDHHDTDPVAARFLDHRPAVGATATILVEHLRGLEVPVSQSLTTALLFAVRRETLGFLRGTTAAEYDAAGWLHGRADRSLLRTLSNPSVSGSTVDTIAEAIRNRIVRQSVLISGVGRTTERDALPQAADYLATLEGVDTTVVFGLVDDSVHLSARSTDPRVHVGRVLEEAFADVGSAGGHREMAGGEVPLGVFAGYTDDHLLDVLEEVVTARLEAAFDLAAES